MATATVPRDERLDARVTREEKEMIETAASLSGTLRFRFYSNGNETGCPEHDS